MWMMRQAGRYMKVCSPGSLTAYFPAAGLPLGVRISQQQPKLVHRVLPGWLALLCIISRDLIMQALAAAQHE